MSGRRLLDAIRVLNATRNVATKHLALQRQHLDVHARTSSLTKGAKSQLDRIELAIKAAADLARKLNNDAPKTTVRKGDAGSGKAEDGEDVAGDLNLNEVRQDEGPGERKEAVKTNSIEPVESKDVDTRDIAFSDQDSSQEKAQKTPEPLTAAENNTARRNSGSAGNGTVDGQDELPEDMMKQLFRSRKTSNSLFGKRYGAKPGNLGDMAEGTSPAHDNSLAQGVPSAIPTSTIPVVPKLEVPPETPTVAQESNQENSTLEDAGTGTLKPEIKETPIRREYQMVESRVPSSRLGRLWEYSGLATSMAFGIMGEGIRRVTRSDEASTGSLLLSPANIERLVAKLSKMRGAALKLGQMLSFQDSKMLPPTIQEVLQRVQDRADYMPASQRDRVLTDNLGPKWRELFETFGEIPIAAASIGQVHAATLKGTGQRVAVKVQYPGVANSIDSDLNNLSILLTASRLLPKGLYLDKTIANARTELAWECDYTREAECAQKFRQLLQDETSTFVVPEVIPSASGKQVLTMEHMAGIAVTKIHTFTQPQRDWIGTQILRLCLREICEFRYMQTDPNWTNFLYNAATHRLELLDFGASRAYRAAFITTYIRILVAASRNDRKTLHELSIELGYLTGFESQAMINAHVQSILTLAEPFRQSSPAIYDFSDQTITERVKELIPLMLRERLAPPPEETYSLHRKLSGAFLLCARLGSRVPCRELFENALEKVKWEEE
ncbi:hypothetical protein PRK78_007439 [Emydomyces testavorans]|uniref:ABC1 atypical kinase-like domain-containing protein n=1 Tax=Emydomyces testavorans TaxID=2070801 RepID=A0AAF0DP92_9EURO|nr:hypothetical protein PRK78_007439 [Emydomyces testavorans]